VTDVPHCLRRVDTDLHYPNDLADDVHDDGPIWSRALWDIRGALGNANADTIIPRTQFDFDGSSMPTLARSTVATAGALYGNATRNAVRAAFEDRRILP
jgi:hypothetical protein